MPPRSIFDDICFWSTNLGRDAYIHDHCLGYRHNYLFFYQLSNGNLFTHRMLFPREKPLVKTMPPESIFYRVFFRSIIPKTQKYLVALFIYLFYFVFYSHLFIQSHTNQSIFFTVEGLTTPLTHWVASLCSLCAGTIFIVLLGSPTGLTTLVS